jgi:uncharacterized protein (TIGR02118 family)
MTIVYQNGPDVKFNFDYYVSTHMPLIMRLYGKSISRFELRRGQPGTDGAAPPYVATITIWIAGRRRIRRRAGATPSWLARRRAEVHECGLDRAARSHRRHSIVVELRIPPQFAARLGPSLRSLASDRGLRACVHQPRSTAASWA